MKKIFIAILLIPFISIYSQKILVGEDAASIISDASLIRYVDSRNSPDYILLNKESDLSSNNVQSWLQTSLDLSDQESLQLIKIEMDKLGMEHRTYQHYYLGVPIQYSTYKVHLKGNKVISVNGQLYKNNNISLAYLISSEEAMLIAKNHVGAQIYKWELPEEEKFIKWRNKNENATYYPSPQLVFAPTKGIFKDQEFQLCWKMEIYAHLPFSRQIVYVNAVSGEIVWREEEICHTDTPGTGITAYSGSQNIIADSFGGSFRLREAGRGDGIETYNLNQGTNYGLATDFTDDDNNWISPVPANDQYAIDAHWGAEMTYDYLLTKHGRNSIDGNGFALLSFIHYDVNYANAFWNGSEMTYGDGSGMITPLTTVDITGHEITHGLTNFTANLIYQDESGALNESFSDIFGVTIDNFARGTSGTSLWKVGEECFPPNGIRLMNNPSSFGDPDTYEGTGWISPGGIDNGGVHINSGVQNYWYYLMCEGGSGVNDNASPYVVDSIGINDAAEIAFRNLTVYLNPNSDFVDARFYSIISAQDIFGDCSPQVETTTNAWHAVGVGSPYQDGINASFSPSAINICTAPLSVSFENNTLTGNPSTSYIWYFGDGTQSTQSNPTHTYPGNGTYDVTLIANAAGCGIDTISYSGLININLPDAPVAANYCTNSNTIIADLTATASGDVYWYSSPSSTTPIYSGNTFTTPSLSSNTTYYIENHVPNGTQHAGPADNTFGSGVYFNSPYSEYLTFTVIQPITLNSVKVYSGSAGNRTIELWNGIGTPITSLVANIPAGESIVTLNWQLQPGNYRIGGTSMNLYKIGNGCSYPYVLPSLVSITGSSDGPNRYFYFYDWIISSSCISPRIPVIVNLNAPTASFSWTQTDQVVTFTNTSINGTSYFWDFGGGNTSTLANPVHDYIWGGTHHATLVVGNNGCYDTLSMDLEVIGIEDNAQLSGTIYPIPFKDLLNIELSLDISGKEIDISSYNLLGEKVSQVFKGTTTHNNFSYTWTVPQNMASGVYLIRIRYNGKELAKRVVRL